MYGMMGRMFGCGYPSTWNWWWMIGFGLLKTALIIGLIVWIVKSIKNKRYEKTSQKAISILGERFVAGEITEEEYKLKLKVLNE